MSTFDGEILVDAVLHLRRKCMRSAVSPLYEKVILWECASRVFVPKVTLHNGTAIMFSPERIGSYILTYLRETAASSLGREVNRAVISVPAEFDQSQRNATRLAAVMAGLDIWRVIQEPTAAAMAYGLHEVEGIQMVSPELSQHLCSLQIHISAAHPSAWQPVRSRGNVLISICRHQK